MPILPNLIITEKEQRKRKHSEQALTVGVAYVGPDPSMKIRPSSEACDIACKKNFIHAVK